MTNLPTTMTAVVLTGHGGIDMLHYREDIAVPSPAADEVLIRIAAAGINNTDINTRIGWYSKANSEDTGAGAAEGLDAISADDASWSGIPLQFPRIQGADCCGTIVAVGAGVSADRIGERVLVRSVMTARDTDKPFMSWTFGSEMDGAFAQYAAAPADETFSVDSTWSDVELASIPCAYSTAENMLHRGDLGADRVLVTGASGGVGSAAIQLAKRRGAEVIALSSAAKTEQVRALGADRVLDRNADLVAELGRDSIDYVVDLVGGPDWPSLLDIMRLGARYSVAGAIAGPIVELDLRTLYLKDLSFFGATYQEPIVFQNLIDYIERNEISPVISATYPLSDIHTAQEDFIAKKHTGKLVLVP